MTRATLFDIHAGRTKLIQAATEERILAVPVSSKMMPGRAIVPAVGSHRRIRALMAIGHTQRVIATSAGLDETRVSKILRNSYAKAETAAAIARAFEELHMTPGVSVRNRIRAKRNGWPLPMQWDEETIDDPDALPEVDGGGPASRMDLYREMQHMGLNDRQIANRFHISLDSLQAWLRRQQEEAA